jgi:SAM-dependent methyltransferase
VEVLRTLGGDRRFDAIVCCDVVEHLADPVRALGLVHGALVPDGALLLTVPDAGSPIARLLRGRWWSVLPMHLHYFTRVSLSIALTSAGFRTVHVARHAKAFSSGYYAGRVAAAVPAVHGVATAAAGSRLGQLTVAPNLHDRLLVIARRG